MRPVPRLPVLLFMGVLVGGCRANPHPTLAIGAPAPAFALPGVDGKVHALADYADSPVLVVVFTCNHCPASELYEHRIEQLYDDYGSRGAAVVAINPDSPKSVLVTELAYTDVADSLEEMKQRAAYRHLAYPYLYDGDAQAAAIAFGAVTTPQVFVFDQRRTLRYEGRIDDNSREALVTTHDARNAIEALLAGRPVSVATTTAAGCPTPWLTQASGVADERDRIQAEPVTLQIAGPADLKKLRQNGTPKVMLVNFWATWCTPCAVEFPDLLTTYRMYRRRNLQLVTVSENTPEEQRGVLTFLKDQHASSDNRLFASDDTGGLQAAFDPLLPASVPFTLVIAPNGDVVHQQLGELNILELRRAILASFPDDGQHAGLQGYWSGKSF